MVAFYLLTAIFKAVAEGLSKPSPCYGFGAMAKDSILFSDEHSDAQLVIVVIFGIFGLFYQPLLVVIGAAIIAVPFIVTWAVKRVRPY